MTWKQSILTKQPRIGVIPFLLCESESGYIWRSLIYTGKEMTDALVGDEYDYVVTTIVFGLLRVYLIKVTHSLLTIAIVLLSLALCC